jgi:predicted dehydrogenase
MVTVGVFGANQKGEGHIRLLSGMPGFEFRGVYDPEYAAAKVLCDQFNLPFFATPDALISSVDALVFELPADLHFDLLVQILTSSKHLWVDYPVSLSLEKINQLSKLSREADVIIQISGHERFNPAFQGVVPYLRNPKYIEIQRGDIHSEETKNLDLLKKKLVQDIDLAINLSSSNVQRINANGVQVVNDPTDLINARLEFDNGCVANLTWNNYSRESIHRCIIFQKGEWYSLDLYNHLIHNFSVENLTADPASNQPGQQSVPVADPVKANPLPEAHSKELVSFKNAVSGQASPFVDIDEAFFAVRTLHELLDKIAKKT